VIQSALAVEGVELVPATDRLLVDQDLRDGEAAGELSQHSAGIHVAQPQMGLGVVDALALEKGLGPRAETAGVAGVDVDLRHPVEDSDRRADRVWCHNRTVATYETEAIVLRTIRFSEADNIVNLLTLERGRVAAIAKGARRPKSRLGGRLQPGVRVNLALHQGRGDVHGIRGAASVEPNAGLWIDSYRLLGAGAVLETAMRALPEDEPSEGAYHLTARALGLLARAEPVGTPPRLDRIVLGYRAKLLVAIGFLPQLSGCVSCGSSTATTAFSARLGGTLCDDCAGTADYVGAPVLDALRQLLGAPLAEAGAMEQSTAEGVEHLVGSVLLEHLGVALRSAPSL